jgi:hypothetical protein
MNGAAAGRDPITVATVTIAATTMTGAGANTGTAMAGMATGMDIVAGIAAGTTTTDDIDERGAIQTRSLPWDSTERLLPSIVYAHSTGRLCRLPLEHQMNLKLLTAAAIITAFSAPAFAANSYYVVQDSTTKKCRVVHEKPTTTTSVVVSPTGKVYTTEDEAEAAMKTITVCESK